MFASLTPLRFAGGQMHTVPPQTALGHPASLRPRRPRDALHPQFLSAAIPRSCRLREKLTTMLHELWHIGPKFDGDLRRFGGRCFAHGSSQKHYDAHIEALLDRWLSLSPARALYDFLRPTSASFARHGRVFGRRVPVPKLVPLD